MMTDHELNSLLEDFLTDTQTANNEAFVKQVMSELPQGSQWLWMRDVFSAILCFVGMLAVWKFKVLTPAVVLSMLSKGLDYIQMQMDMLSPMSLMALGAGLLFLVCYYAYATFAEI